MTQTKKNNAAFTRMTPAQQRVAIAQDVIAQLLAKRYKATIGTYVEAKINSKQLADEDSWESSSVSVDVKKVLNKEMKSCQVCAKGALFVAAVERFNNLEVAVYDQKEVLEGYNDPDAICDHLSYYFDQEQLDLIEYVFEDGKMGDWQDCYRGGKVTVHSNHVTDTQYVVKNVFVATYPYAVDRMIAIMENIIDNDGEFVLDTSILTVKQSTPKRPKRKAKAKKRSR